MAAAPRSTARRPVKPPANRPTGVRTAETMTDRLVAMSRAPRGGLAGSASLRRASSPALPERDPAPDNPRTGDVARIGEVQDGTDGAAGRRRGPLRARHRVVRQGPGHRHGRPGPAHGLLAEE